MTALLIVALVLWSAGWLLLGRVTAFGSGMGKKVPADRLSIIIPARNEEQNLPTLLRSIAAQSVRPGEIIVVNDASTDRTAEIARQSGAVVLDSQPLPEGWRGKTWACHQGAEAATGGWLLFLDADTWFEPQGLARLFGLYDGDPLSLGPFHVVRRAYEELSLFFNSNMVVGTVPDGLFGQMLMYRLSQSEHAANFVLKGAMMFLVWTGAQYRATKDMDLLALKSASVERLRDIFRELCELPVAQDGLAFEPDSVKAEEIREDPVSGCPRVARGAAG